MADNYRGGPLELSDSQAADQYRREHANDFAYMRALPSNVIGGIWNTPEMRLKRMLELFKSFNPDRTQVEELIALLSFGRDLKATYDEFGDAPAWVEQQCLLLEKAIRNKMDAELENRISSLRLQREALRTTEEKRKNIESELAELEGKRRGTQQTSKRR